MRGKAAKKIRRYCKESGIDLNVSKRRYRRIKMGYKTLTQSQKRSKKSVVMATIVGL